MNNRPAPRMAICGPRVTGHGETMATFGCRAHGCLLPSRAFFGLRVIGVGAVPRSSGLKVIGGRQSDFMAAWFMVSDILEMDLRAAAGITIISTTTAPSPM